MKINSGFTLIELMIVVAIIGILSMIAVPAYQDYTARTRFAEILTILQSQKTALVDEYATQGSCVDRTIPTSEIGSPYIASMSTKGVARIAGSTGGSFVQMGSSRFPTVCTIVVNMSQKGKDYFKRGNKPATTFYINLADANGSFVWGCAAGTNFSHSVTSKYCQIPAV